MFKVLRIKEEHSAFRSDGGWIGSRGFACVRPHHASLFVSIPPVVCLSLSPCYSSLLLSPLSVFIVSHFISSPPLFFLFTRSLYPSPFLQSSSVSVFLSRCRVSPLSHLLSSIHPSISSSPSLSLSIHFYHLCTFLSSSLAPSIPSSLPPPALLSLPRLFHFLRRPIRLMAFLIGCSRFKRGMT